MSSFGPPAPREISVTVHVVDQRSKPIANVPLLASADRDGLAGRTDANGACTLTGAVKDDYGRFFVAILPYNAPQSTTFRRDTLRVKEIKDSYAVEQIYVVPLQDGISDYTLKVTAYDGVTVRGRLLNRKGEPTAGSVAGFNRAAIRALRRVLPCAGPSPRQLPGGPTRGTAAEQAARRAHRRRIAPNHCCKGGTGAGGARRPRDRTGGTKGRGRLTWGPAGARPGEP